MTEMLGQAFVKIQYVNDAQNHAGCGFVIDTEHIVTCAHVLESANNTSTPQNGQLFTVDMPFINLKNIIFELIDFIPVKEEKISFNDFDDLALLKIQSPNEKITSPQIRITRAYKENKNPIILYSQKSKNWVEGQTKAPTEEGWLQIFVDSQVEPGDSGSPVWNSNIKAITGMLVARKRNNSTCYMISLWKIADAFKGYVALLKEPSSQLYKTVSDQEYLEEIINSIELDLKQSPIFHEKIIAEVKVPSNEKKNLIRYLVNLCQQGEMINVIQGLQSALVESMDSLENSPSILGKVFSSASSLLSKLVLFNIRDAWMKDYLAECAEHSSQVFQLPEMELNSLEIITSRQFQILPKLDPEKNSRFSSQTGGRSVLLESGIKTEQAVNDVIKQLYCKVMKGVSITKLNTIDDKEIKFLRKTISQRQKQENWKLRQSYFVVIPNNENTPFVDIEAQSKLAELVPELQWIMFKFKGKEEILMIDDIDLSVAINEFFETLENYKAA